MSRTLAEVTAQSLIDGWTRDIAGAQPRISLADGEDSRCVQAALRLHAAGVVIPVLVGRPAEVNRVALSLGARLPSDLPVHDPLTAAHAMEYGDVLADVLSERGRKGVLRQEVLDMRTDPVYVAALMVRLGYADGAVAGACRSTADVIRAGLRVIGLAPGSSAVSSCFLMALANGRTLSYGDCVVIPTPTPDQLAEIAINTATTHAELTGETPVVALLSFSTKGSASHPSVDRVSEAVRLVREQAPELAVDGELQFDAAYVPGVGEMKAPQSSVAGRANVFIFPDLQAGNIGYKITERVGGAIALGPVLQGLAAPMNDLSRGCGVEDVVAAAIITARNPRKREHVRWPLDGSRASSRKEVHRASK